LIGTGASLTPHGEPQCRPSVRKRVNADPLEPDLLLQILEQPKAAAQQHRHDVDFQLVNGGGPQ
jgi:hypothetical protein